MAIAVCTGASMMCTFGVAPASLVALPTGQLMTPAVPSANSLTFAPVANIPPFGACSSLANPTVASATAAALGVLTPMPCVPMTTTPWIPGPTTTINGAAPAVDISCKLMCMWGGTISVLSPGQTAVIVQ
jgi:hypothetical protein